MPKPKRYTAQQITRILEQQEAGVKVAEICRQANISEQTFYRRKSKFGGMGVSDIHRLKALEKESRRLKQLLGDAILDNQALNAVQRTTGTAVGGNSSSLRLAKARIVAARSSENTLRSAPCRLPPDVLVWTAITMRWSTRIIR